MMSCKKKEIDHDYKPLPEGLAVWASPIHGQGVFTNIHLSSGQILGKTHYYWENSGISSPHLIRSPLGGFLNHCEEPNCELIHSHETLDGGYRALLLTTKRKIVVGEELTVDYRCSPCGGNMREDCPTPESITLDPPFTAPKIQPDREHLSLIINGKELDRIDEIREALRRIYGEEGGLEYRIREGSGVGVTVSVWSDLAQKEIEVTDYESW